jgi:hypothetical protein
MVIRIAERKFRFLKIGVGGISGSGKTLGALNLAKGIAGSWEEVCVIDSENASAEIYSHLGRYSVCPLTGTGPQNYIAAINEVYAAKKFKVCIVDSISHEWAGTGGILDMVNNIGGNSYAAWAKGTPVHNNFVEHWLKMPMHIIATMRAKDEYVLKENGKGKLEPVKVGLKNIQRDGIDFEFDVVFRVESNHKACAEKHRTNLFTPTDYFELSEDLGKRLIAWTNEGSPENEPSEQPTAKPAAKHSRKEEPKAGASAFDPANKKHTDWLAGYLDKEKIDPSFWANISADLTGKSRDDLEAVLKKYAGTGAM